MIILSYFKILNMPSLQYSKAYSSVHWSQEYPFSWTYVDIFNTIFALMNSKFIGTRIPKTSIPWPNFIIFNVSYGRIPRTSILMSILQYMNDNLTPDTCHLSPDIAALSEKIWNLFLLQAACSCSTTFFFSFFNHFYWYWILKCFSFALDFWRGKFFFKFIKLLICSSLQQFIALFFFLKLPHQSMSIKLHMKD